uniref:Uncharacterized protein n=1 Tax=Arundo donax TaxID=35708 RepID=A0A0A9HE68_ARUDO
MVTIREFDSCLLFFSAAGVEHGAKCS